MLKIYMMMIMMCNSWEWTVVESERGKMKEWRWVGVNHWTLSNTDFHTIFLLKKEKRRDFIIQIQMLEYFPVKVFKIPFHVVSDMIYAPNTIAHVDTFFLSHANVASSIVNYTLKRHTCALSLSLARAGSRPKRTLWWFNYIAWRQQHRRVNIGVDGLPWGSQLVVYEWCGSVVYIA